ncbi:MAG: UDP-N-acetylmuramate dehydrogenase, partial [Eggerthellaceae bacterium]|nr:UDP-N-acetylmuramate dehydrogenase [Eggerthellaceae bacterium]
IGLGSDLLVADEGVRGLVLKIADNLSDIRVEGTQIIAEAGASNEAVAAAAQAAGLSGYEFACGIPGTIGGAAIMNAGAYDGEFKDVAVSLTCLTPEGDVVEVSAEEADWSYRHSMMDSAGYIVLSAVLQLAEGDPEEIQARMDDLQTRRADKQPLEMPSAGSTFKRPVGYFAGKLIQDAELMGYRVGGAQVSTKHAGFVVNAGGATAADVRQLISDVQDRVFAEAGVRLEPEVRMWGFEA